MDRGSPLEPKIFISCDAKLVSLMRREANIYDETQSGVNIFAGAPTIILKKGDQPMNQDCEVVHACIRVLDLEASIEFYETALNFEVARRRDFPEDEFTLVYLESPAGHLELELTYNYGREEPYTIGNGFSHFAVTVDDLEEAHQYHQELGYEVSELKSLSEEASGGYYFLTDPDGYRTEIIQRQWLACWFTRRAI